MKIRKQLRHRAVATVSNISFNGKTIPVRELDESIGAVDVPCFQVSITEDALVEGSETLQGGITIDATIEITAYAKTQDDMDDILDLVRLAIREGKLKPEASSGYSYSSFTLDEENEGDAKFLAGTVEYIARTRTEV